MAKKPDPHDLTEKLLQEKNNCSVVPYFFALRLKSYLKIVLEISPTWLPTRTRLRLINAFRKSDHGEIYANLEKPPRYKTSIPKMIEGKCDYTSPDKLFSDDLCDHLEAAVYFFATWGHKHPSAQLTGLMQLAACDLILTAERIVGALHYHEIREGKRVEAIRTGKGRANKEENTKKALELFASLPIEAKKSQAEAIRKIIEAWPTTTPPHENTFKGYIGDAFRRYISDKR